MKVFNVLCILQNAGKIVESDCSYTPAYFAKLSETDENTFNTLYKDVIGENLKTKIDNAIKERKLKNSQKANANNNSKI